jgi:hypothetical protein
MAIRIRCADGDADDGRGTFVLRRRIQEDEVEMLVI